jgi:RNA polymerase sigma factor (sigma-70 family)
MHIFKGILANTTDQELIKKYKNTSDLDYVAELYNRHLHLIFTVSLKYLKVKEDAEDLSIKIFEVLKEKLPEQEIENFGGWLHTVTKNQCLMHLRTESRNQIKEDEYANFMEIDNAGHHNNEIDIEIDLRKLENCIKSLVQEQKRCIELFYKQEKCYKEVANLTGYGLKKVKSYLQNGKRNLEICMAA